MKMMWRIEARSEIENWLYQSELLFVSEFQSYKIVLVVISEIGSIIMRVPFVVLHSDSEIHAHLLQRAFDVLSARYRARYILE